MRFASVLVFVVCSVAYYSVFSQNEYESKRAMLQHIRKADSLIYDNPKVSLQFALKVDSMAQRVGDDSLLAVAKNRIGSAYWSKGDLKLAYLFIEKSLELAEANGYKVLMAKNLGNIGNIYSASGLKLDAIELYKSELKLLDSTDAVFRYFASYNNIGKAYVDINYPDSSLYYLGKAGRFIRTDWEHLWSIFYFNQAEAYFKMRQFDSADSLLNLAEENALSFKSDRGLIRVYQLRAELLLLEDQTQLALALATKATEMATASQVKELVYITQRTLSNCYAGMGEFQLAHAHRALSDTYQDSVLYLTSKNEIELTSYINRKVHLETLTQRNILIQRITEQQRYLIWGLSMVVCVVSVLLFVLFRNRRAISVQKRELEKLNAFKVQLFSIVAHDLRSPVLSIAGVLEALNNKLATKEDIAPLLPEMQRKIVGLQKLFSDLLDWGRLQMKHSELTYDAIDMDELISSISQEFAENMEQKGITMQISLDVTEVRSNKEMLQISIRNLISNAIKFSHPDAEIIFRTTSEKRNIRIDVQDTGVGLSKSAITKLRSGRAQSQTGTRGETGSGLGMAICIDFIHRLGGQLVIESKEGKGTTFSIMLPS